jgi:hypothetical protein
MLERAGEGTDLRAERRRQVAREREHRFPVRGGRPADGGHLHISLSQGATATMATLARSADRLAASLPLGSEKIADGSQAGQAKPVAGVPGPGHSWARTDTAVGEIEMTTFMSRKKSVSFIHQDMRVNAYGYPEDARAARRPPRRR